MLPNCQECYSGSICALCTNNHVVVNGQCQPCGDNSTQNFYYVQNNLCTLCNIGVEYCEQCSSQTQCTECQSGFYVNDGKCVACGAVMASCIVCDGPSLCLACNSGFYLSNNECLECQTAV